MSLAMVCKNDALDVVKTVTRKRGFESWRKLCKEYGSCRSCGKWRLVSECRQGFVRGVQEVTSSSASSVAPSAATTPAASKTAAAIQEVNDENGPGWNFGMVDGSVASVTTDRDDMWDELVLDSGSVSTACPYAW